MCDAVRDWGEHARRQKKKKNNEKQWSRKNTPVPKKYGNTRGIALLKIHVILEFDNAKLYSTFDLQ